MELTVISPPAEAALSLASAKAFLRIGHDGEDTLVTGLVASTESALEQAIGLCLVSRTLRLSWTGWPTALLRCGVLSLRPGPAVSLVAVRSVEGGGNSVELTDRFNLHDSRLVSRTGAVLPWIGSDCRFEVDYIAGFGTAEDIPADLILAVKSILQAGYSRGDQSGVLPTLAAGIAASRREVRI